MEKIYNNLNIENLIKTKAFNKLAVGQKEELLTSSQWFKQFQPYQQEEILAGLEANIDVLLHAKKEFDSFQMSEMREGLEKNLDVSVYLNNKFNWAQMQEIRFGLMDNLDISTYATTDFNMPQME